MSIFKPDPYDFFGQAISLQCSVREFQNEVTVDVCENSPRLVVMAVSDLVLRVDSIVASMQAKMEQNRKEELEGDRLEIE